MGQPLLRALLDRQTERAKALAGYALRPLAPVHDRLSHSRRGDAQDAFEGSTEGGFRLVAEPRTELPNR